MPDNSRPELMLDVDPSLIEAALASVDRVRAAANSASPKPDGAGNGEILHKPDADAEFVFDPGEWGEPGPGDGDAKADDGVEIDIPGSDGESPARGAPEAPAIGARRVVQQDEYARLVMQVRDQQDLIQRLEARLGRAQEISDGLDRQVRDLRNAYKSLEEDVESSKKRQRREREESERRGEESAVRALIEVADSLERAATFSETDPTKTAAGLQIIREQFRSCLKRLTVERIEAGPGTAFDPAVHEAILHLPTADVAENHVVSEVAVGFRHRGRLLRPARVVVAAAASPSPEAPTERPE